MKPTLALSKNLDEDQAIALSERLQLQAADIAARTNGTAPTIGEDPLENIETLAGFITSTCAASGISNPTQAIIREFTQAPPPTAPPSAARKLTATDRCRAAKAKPTAYLPARMPGESLSDYCRRLNAAK